ncbi:SufS family cysteine desulfurase [Neptuniibacter sp. CAU 1671]|uniref:SufS family cysteine desulfurase n=1 Tax=Neptuniibacter sp. CAU 1671 TaxID=3032593 RepID=UPI0023DC4329|nr:SufS family cysteine desulfurase [Neptuniibacter sp. CAU 1671]MDF2180892.1 SufS family cysteine desulfurase [Neptuniibacter sp. CAU 1671]
MTSLPADPEQYLARLRNSFPVLSQQVRQQPLVYLDNAATTQKPECVIRAIEQFYRQSNANVHRASHHLSAQATHLFEQARKDVARYLNAASPNEIIWTRGTTEGINLVANSWGQRLRPGDEILISALEHHANIVPWQLLAQRSGAAIKVIPLLESGDLDLEAYQTLLNDRTRLVAITHVSNALGTINPLAQIIPLAHQAGAKVLIDGAQALPHLKVDVQTLGADFYLFSGHKVFGPTGIGALWAKQRILEEMPPWQAGGEMITHVSFTESQFQPPPFRFEAGTPNIAGAIGLAAGLNWLANQPHTVLADHEQKLLQRALQGMEQIKGLTRIGQPAASVSLVSFTLQQQHQQDIGILLDQQGIAVRSGHHCAMPLMHCLGLSGTTRASFAFYNTETEVDLLLSALDQISRPVQSAQRHTEQPSASLYTQLKAQPDWNNRYRLLLLAGKALPGLPESDKIDQNRVLGCESHTWLVQRSGSSEALQFQADSEAKIIRGLIALLQERFNGQSAQSIIDTDIDTLFHSLGLEQHLSPSRSNGLHALIEGIKALAQASVQQANP